MMKDMVQKEYEMTRDSIVYDHVLPVDASCVTVTLTAGQGGVVEKGQVIDFDRGMYKQHAAGGTAVCIAAEDTGYGESDTAVSVPVYTNGNLRASAVKTSVELTDTDKENLRNAGIVLK